MDFRSDAAQSRRTAPTFITRLLNGLALCMVALAAMAWSGQSFAQTCDFVNVDPAPSKIGLPGTPVSFTFQAQTACAATVTGTIVISTDSTGGATAPAAFTATLDTDETFNVLLGPTPGGNGTVTVTCVTGGCAGDTLVYNFATNNDFDYVANVATPVVANQITPFTVGTNFQFNGAPGALATTFALLAPATAYGTQVPDAAGDTSTTQSIFNVGAYVVRGTLNCPTAFVLEGCAAVAPVDMAVQIEAVNLLAVGTTTPATASGTPINLAVTYGSASIPAADGTNIAWTVTAQPVGGDGAVIGNPTAGGQSDASFSASVAGVYTVNANSGCTFCATSQQNFTVTVAPPPPTLAVSGGDGQNALPGDAFALPLQVTALNGATPVAGVGVTWTVTGDATLVAGGPTDAAGSTSATVTAGTTPGAVTVVAARQDAPAATATFTLAVGALGTLSIVSGDDQTLVANTVSEPLEVELRDSIGVPVAGATITWSTTAGTLGSATSVTDAAGIASNTITTSVAGAVEVSASSPLASAPVKFALQGALASLPGLTTPQISVAVAIDNACPALAALPAPTPEQQDMLQRCQDLSAAAGIDPGAAVDALDELLPDLALTQANAAFSALQAQFQNLKTRIAALRSGTNGTSFGGLALNTPSGPISLGMLGNAFGADGDPAEIGADFSRWGFFAAGTIGRGEADPGERNPAYDYDIEGLTAGVDYRRNDRWIVGASLGYTRQDTELPGESSGLDTSGWTVSAYTTFYQQDSWYMDGVITWGRNDYELLRRIQYTLPTAGGGSTSVDQTARADASGDLLSTAYTFGRDFNRGAWGMGPYGRLLYTRVGFDAINETLEAGEPGSGLGLRIEDRDVSSLASVLGGKLTYTHSADWGVLIPHVQLEWEHEFKDDPQAVEARFINDPTGTAMVIRGDPLDTDYFRLGLGMSMVLTRGRSGFFYYEQLVGRNGMSQWNLALGLRMEF